MKFLRSFAQAFTLFSTIPMPQVEWDEESMRYMMCFFPFVGLAVGALVWLWALLADALAFGTALRALGFVLAPLLVTGGIHLDGFSDVVDALSSHAEPEKKREILKDPHVGSFAVMGVAAYVVAYFALSTELDGSWQALALLCASYVATRCLSSIATLVFPKSSTEGMLAAEGRTDRKRSCVALVSAELLACVFVMVWVSPVQGGCVVLAALLCLAGTWHMARTQFGGMSGDLAGYFLQVAELLMLACIVVFPHAIAIVS